MDREQIAPSTRSLSTTSIKVGGVSLCEAVVANRADREAPKHRGRQHPGPQKLPRSVKGEELGATRTEDKGRSNLGGYGVCPCRFDINLSTLAHARARLETARLGWARGGITTAINAAADVCFGVCLGFVSGSQRRGSR